MTPNQIHALDAQLQNEALVLAMEALGKLNNDQLELLVGHLSHELMHRKFMTNKELEPIPLPNLYSFENMEAVSDDVQLHLETQRINERNKALGI